MADFALASRRAMDSRALPQRRPAICLNVFSATTGDRSRATPAIATPIPWRVGAYIGTLQLFF
jgi:hypothetical protein